MNIIRRYKERRRHADQIDNQTDEARKTLSLISDSHLPGISALPVEIWGLVIEYVVLEHLGNSRRRCWDLPNIMRYRLVCKPFDEEIQHSLHRNIVLPQVTHLAFMRVIMRRQPGQKPGAALCTALWASALCNSARPPTRGRHRSDFTSIRRIIDRVRNCVIIATQLESEGKATCGHVQPHRNVIRQRLCTAASTSTYCHEYIYMPFDYAQYFRTYAEADAYLETALLVSCGYSSKSVLSAMVKLVKEGKLVPYVADDVQGHIWSGRRWQQVPSGHWEPCKALSCLRCGKTFDIWDDHQHDLEDFY